MSRQWSVLKQRTTKHGLVISNQSMRDLKEVQTIGEHYIQNDMGSFVTDGLDNVLMDMFFCKSVRMDRYVFTNSLKKIHACALLRKIAEEWNQQF